MLNNGTLNPVLYSSIMCNDIKRTEWEWLTENMKKIPESPAQSSDLSLFEYLWNHLD